MEKLKDVKAEVAALNKNEVETRKWEMVKDKDLTPMTNKEGQTEAVHKVSKYKTLIIISY